MSKRVNSIEITGMVATLSESTSKKGMGMKTFTLLPSAHKLKNAALVVLAFDNDNPGYAGIVEGAEVIVEGSISSVKDPDTEQIDLLVLTSNVKPLDKPDKVRNGVAIQLRAFEISQFQARGHTCYRVRASLWTGKDKPMIWLNVTAYNLKPNEILGSLRKGEDFIVEDGNLGFSIWNRADGTVGSSYEINAKVVDYIESETDADYVPDAPEEPVVQPVYEPEPQAVYAPAVVVPTGPISMVPMEEPELDF